ncbi:hypothetical protein ACTFIY_009050 [Dictyostelium cf. discoideum]
MSSDDILITKHDAKHNALYSYMGIRLLLYIFFFILNIFQAYVEGRTMVKKKNKYGTRFFIYLSMSIFCFMRSLSTILFYQNPTGITVGSIGFFFSSIGTICVFCEWVFILHFWLLIMYSFFVSDDIRVNNLKPVNIATVIFIIVLLCYQTFICVGSLTMDLKFGQGVGFLLLLLIYSIMIISFGSALLRSLKKHKKNTSFEHFQDMIFKTKVLLVTLILTFVCTFVEELVFNFQFDFSLKNKIWWLFFTQLIDTTQMIVVMFVLANFKFQNYLLFRKVKTTSFSDKSSLEIDSMGKKNKSSLDLTGGKSLDQSIELENSFSSISKSIDIVVNNETNNSILNTDNSNTLNNSIIEENNNNNN